MYKIDICKSVSEIEKKKKEWIELENSSPQFNITSTYSWLKTFLEVFQHRDDQEFGYKKKLLVMFLYKDAKLIAIAPFLNVQRKYKKIKYWCIEFIGQQWGATFLDIIGESISKEEIELIFNYLNEHERFDVINLKYLPENSQTLHLNSGKSHILTACPYMNIDEFEDFEDFREKVYSKNLKRNMKKAEHKMEKQKIGYSVAEEKITDKNFNAIVELSRKKLVDDKHSIYIDDDKYQFVKSICKELESNVIFCELNGIRVAYRLSFFHKNNKFSFDASYNRDFNKMELGAFSIEESLKDSFNKKVTLHSEGTGVDFYKTKFMKKSEKIFSFTIKGNTLLSFVILRHITKYNKAVEQYFLNQIQANTSK